MKYKLVLLVSLFFKIGFAQENELFEQDWYLQNLFIDGVNYEKPDLHDVFSNTFFTSNTMFTFMCETGGMLGNITVDNDNFEIHFSNVFYDEGECSDSESTEFRDLFYSFFETIENPFHYSITTNETGLKTLTLEYNGNIITYNSLVGLPPETILQNTWYLNDLIIGGVNNPPPINPEFPYIYLEFEENNRMISQVCGKIRGLSDFYQNPNFFIQMMEGEGINCGIEENMDYENLYFSFFWNNYYNPFEYSLSDDGNGNHVLTLIDQNGNQAIYSNQFMSVSDNEKLGFRLYPNPVKDKLTIQNPDLKITSIKLSNASGKIILKQKISGKESQIDLRALPSGVYFISFDENGKTLKTEKIIKK